MPTLIFGDMPLNAVKPIPICLPLSWYRHGTKLGLYCENVLEKISSTQWFNRSYRQMQEKLFACLSSTTFSRCNMTFFNLPLSFICSKYLSEIFRLIMVLKLSKNEIIILHSLAI